jgi:hypothetical protein
MDPLVLYTEMTTAAWLWWHDVSRTVRLTWQ